MPLPSTPARFYDIYAPQKNGVYGNVFGQAADDIQSFIAGDAIKQRIALLAPAANTTLRNFDFIDPTGATVEFGIGGIDGGRVFNPPTGGTFQLSYNGSTTGLTVLAYDITAAALKAALEANTTFNPGGNTVTVTVTKYATGVYRVAWDQVGVRFLFAADGSNLTPGSTATASRVVTGSASVKEVQIVRLLQRPYAYNATWSALSSAAASVTQLQTGTSALPSIQRVSLDPEPYDGSLIVTFGKTQVVRVLCKANTGAVAEISTVQTVADVASSLGGLYFTIYDNVGPVRVWIDVANASTAPGVPAGGRLLEVNISADATAAAVATAVQGAVDADSKFAATVSSNLVVITDSNTGTRTDIAAGTSTFTVACTTQGVNSSLDDKYFLIYDDSNQSVAVWLTVDSASPPSGVTDAARYLTVAIGAADSASTIGGLIATVVDADADFTAANASGIVTITNAVNGTRTAATSGDSGFGVSVTGSGIVMSPVIAWNAAEQDLQLAIDPDAEVVTVSKSGPFSWDFKFVENGSRSALATDVTGLKVPIGLQGTLSLNTEQMLAASVANDFAPFDAIIEGVVTFSGELPWVFYQEIVTINPRLLDFSTLAPNGFLTYLTATAGGDVSIATDDTEVTISPSGAASNITLSLIGKGASGARLVSPNGKVSINAINGDLAATCGNAGDTEIMGFDLTTDAFSILDEVNPDFALLRITPSEGAFFRDAIAGQEGAGIILTGTATNDSAAAGKVGQIISSLVAVGSPVSLTSPNASNVTSISLTAGDWDVEGNINFLGTGATTTVIVGGVTSTSATTPTDGSEVHSGLQLVTTTATDGVTLPRKRFSLSGTTTVYLVAKATFSAGTVVTYGAITARRVR